VGILLLFTRPLVGSSGAMANSDHLIGALALTVVSLASAEGALLVTPYVFDADLMQTGFAIVCGVALVLLSLRRGEIRGRYGEWQPYIR
jgi:hypothetical protein